MLTCLRIGSGWFHTIKQRWEIQWPTNLKYYLAQWEVCWPWPGSLNFYHFYLLWSSSFSYYFWLMNYLDSYLKFLFSQFGQSWFVLLAIKEHQLITKWTPGMGTSNVEFWKYLPLLRWKNISDTAIQTQRWDSCSPWYAAVKQLIYQLWHLDLWANRRILSATVE